MSHLGGAGRQPPLAGCLIPLCLHPIPSDEFIPRGGSKGCGPRHMAWISGLTGNVKRCNWDMLACQKRRVCLGKRTLTTHPRPGFEEWGGLKFTECAMLRAQANRSRRGRRLLHRFRRSPARNIIIPPASVYTQCAADP